MYRLLGLSSNLENICALSSLTYKKQDSAFNSLKTAYKDFLTRIQPKVPRSNSLNVEFLQDDERTNKLIELFGEKSRLDDFKEVFSSHMTVQKEHVKIAETHLLSLREIDRELFAIFNLVVNMIFSGPSDTAGGGSTSGAIGCIWINPRPHWTQSDFFEFFVHEFTHNLVFLDELRYRHYTNYSSIIMEENYSPSAILAKKRPLDKVFHSILVSTEVLLTRQTLLGHPETPRVHPPTQIMLEQCLFAIHSLEENPGIFSLLTERAKTLLTMCKNKLENYMLEIECVSVFG